MDEREPRLIRTLRELDSQLAGLSPSDDLFRELELVQLHEAHGVAGRIQDRVITVMTRLTMEMGSREDEDLGIAPGNGGGEGSAS